MAAPAPLVPMSNQCSVIYDHTLYVYSPDAFQSLDMKEGGKWSQLDMGVSATGASCVLAITKDDEAMYVVGGISNATESDYTGLQLYSFRKKAWSTVPLVTKVTANRTNHAATYLDSPGKILVYAGSQDGTTGPSSQTFCIPITEPYIATSYVSKANPPLVAPQLLPFNDSHAALFGGSPTEKGVYLFSPESGWNNLGASLDKPIPDRAKVQATIVHGDDNSTVLQAFDMSATPNTVDRVVLQDAGGKPPAPSQSSSPHKERHIKRRGSNPPPAKRRKRDLTVANWPTYNGTNAPSTTRTGFSLAQDTDGLVVLAGGDDKNPIEIFNTTENSWVNTTQFFNGQATIQSTGDPSVVTLQPSSTPTSSAVASSTSDAESNAEIKHQSMQILGAVLGAVVGVILLLVAILYCLKWRHRKQAHIAAGHQRRASNLMRDDKDRLSFADRGASFMSEAGGYMPPNRTRYGRNSILSASSISIMTGRAGQGHNRRGLFDKVRGGRSPQAPQELQMHEQQKLGVGAGDEKGVQFAPSPVAGYKARTTNADGSGKQRSSGWSRYFSGGTSATNLAHSHSTRSNSSHESQTYLTHASHEQIPLPTHDVKIDPYSSPKRGTAAPMPTAHIPRRHSSAASSVSSFSRDRDDAFSSGIPASIHDDPTWSPMGNNGKAWQSSNTLSSHATTTTTPPASSNHPLPPQQHQRATSSIYTLESAPRNSAFTRSANGAVGRDSTNTMFPQAGDGRGRDSDALGNGVFPQRGPGVTVSGVGDWQRERSERELGTTRYEDMSWLNLGGGR
ncbi:MAG: hypothetical protein M1824_000927 [Vezdaea acicularis]|nr:MAG: hypothetical protein M1824_000927 [Vezdaea acicularis]